MIYNGKKAFAVIEIIGYNNDGRITSQSNRKEGILQVIWFQKYRILEEIGRGGTAEVYLAEHMSLKVYRAIKCIKKNHPLYDSQYKEAQILKNLKHSNIPIIYDIEEDENSSYIIEEYLEGPSLRVYIKELSDSYYYHTIIQFTIQLCDLFLYLHNLDRPILYLDLKPDNIIVAEGTLKLVDFGSAVYQDQADQIKAYSGTKGYAAPELYHPGRADKRSDIFSIGMLMYFMITGHFMTSNRRRVRPTDDKICCPNDLKKIIKRCLQYYPTQRYASVTLLRDKLLTCGRSLENKKNSERQIRFAVAGAQSRIGVTHFALRLCGYHSRQHKSSIYIEKNSSGTLRELAKYYDVYTDNQGIYHIHGIKGVENTTGLITDTAGCRFAVEDYGTLTQENLKDFLKAEVPILILGSKPWELYRSEQALSMISDYKGIHCLFNYTGGKQYQMLMRSMGARECRRIVYEPDPFDKYTDEDSLELLRELTAYGERQIGSRQEIKF